MKARDVMTRGVVSVVSDTPMRKIAALLLEKHISAVPVVDGSGAPIGFVSEGDLTGRSEVEREARQDWWLTTLAEGEPVNPEFLASLTYPTARQIMSAPVITVGEDTNLEEIARLLSTHRIKRVPVVRDGRIVGIVSRADPRRMSLSCRRCAADRRRHRAEPLRRAPQHDEEWPRTWAKRAFWAAATSDTEDVRHFIDGPVVSRPVLGLADRGAKAAGDGELRPLYFGNLRRPLRQLRRTEIADNGEQPAAAGALVRSQIVKANGEPANVDYMMRRSGDHLLISDIYLDGAISEVATRRSEFAAILKDQGIDGLIAALNRKADILTATTAKAS